MFKQYIKRMCLKKKILHRIIYEPYSAHCEKRRQRLADEQDYRLNDPEYCLRGLQRLQGVNFWFLLEQGHNNIGDIAIGIAERRFLKSIIQIFRNTIYTKRFIPATGVKLPSKFGPVM